MTELKKTPPKTVDQDPGVAVDSTQPAEAPVAAPPVKLWLGVSLWLILCLVYLAVGATGFFELWLIVPFIGVLVASQALEKRMRTRRNFGLIGIFLALMSIVLGVLMLVWPANKPYVYPLAVFLIVGGLLALSCLVRRSRRSLVSNYRSQSGFGLTHHRCYYVRIHFPIIRRYFCVDLGRARRNNLNRSERSYYFIAERCPTRASRRRVHAKTRFKEEPRAIRFLFDHRKRVSRGGGPHCAATLSGCAFRFRRTNTPA